MSEQDIAQAAPATETAPNLSTETIPSSGSESLSAREASRLISGYREQRDGTGATEEAPQTEEAAPAELTAEQASEIPADSAQPDEQSAIEAPRSWSKEHKEWFAQLPPSLQQYVNQRETERDTALRRGQNEAATLRQSLQEKERAVDQMRQQYEQVLPALMQQLQEQQMGQFADIKTQADVDRLARDDWQRFAMWQAHQMKVQNTNQMIQANYQRQQQEYAQKWNDFAKNEDGLFAQQATEMNDPQQAHTVATQAVTALRDIGFSDDDISKLWSGQASVSLRDHRMQLLVRDAARYRAAKTGAPAKKASLPASRTLRPGTPAERASDAQVNLDSLNKTLDNTGKWKDGAELLLARRAARRR